jgi:hypothetical protein
VVHGRERVGRRRDRRRVEGARIDPIDAVVAEHEEAVEGVEVLEEERARDVAAEVEAPHDDVSLGRAGDEVGCEMGPGDRARSERAAELLEDQDRLGAAEPHAAPRLVDPQAEDAHLGELAPEAAVEAAALERAQLLEGESRGAEGPHPGGELTLLVGRAEAHVTPPSPDPSGARGSVRR